MTDHPIPTSEGYYWARYIGDPEIVFVRQDGDDFVVLQVGQEPPYLPLSDFGWGPRVELPEGLK